MNEVPLHPTHLQFSQLPPSTRALYSAVLLVLGLAYLFGGIYLYHTYAGRAGGTRSSCRTRTSQSHTAATA